MGAGESEGSSMQIQAIWAGRVEEAFVFLVGIYSIMWADMVKL